MHTNEIQSIGNASTRKVEQVYHKSDLPSDDVRDALQSLQDDMGFYLSPRGIGLLGLPILTSDIMVPILMSSINIETIEITLGKYSLIEFSFSDSAGIHHRIEFSQSNSDSMGGKKQIIVIQSGKMPKRTIYSSKRIETI